MNKHLRKHILSVFIATAFLFSISNLKAQNVFQDNGYVLCLFREQVFFIPDSVYQNPDSTTISVTIGTFAVDEEGSYNETFSGSLALNNTNYFEYLGSVIVDSTDSVSSKMHGYRFISSSIPNPIPAAWPMWHIDPVYKGHSLGDYFGIRMSMTDIRECPSRGIVQAAFPFFKALLSGSTQADPPTGYDGDFAEMTPYRQQVMKTVMNWVLRNNSATVSDYLEMLDPTKCWQSDAPSVFCINGSEYSCDGMHDMIQTIFYGDSLLGAIPDSNIFTVQGPLDQLPQQPIFEKYGGTYTPLESPDSWDFLVYTMRAGLPSFVSKIVYDGGTIYKAAAYSYHATSSVGITYSGSGTFSYSNGYVPLSLDSIGVWFPHIAINASGPLHLCNGDSVLLTLSPLDSIGVVWSTGDSGSYVEAVRSDLYFAHIPSTFGCAVTSDSVFVKKFDADGYAGMDTVICKGRAFNLGSNISSLNGTPPYTMQWSPGTTLNDSTAPNPSATPSITTTYIVSITDSNSCTGVDSITITILQGPSAIQIKDSICLNDTLTLTVDTLVGTTNHYSWNTGDTTSSIIITSPSIYNAVITSTNGCQSYISDTVLLKTGALIVSNDTVCSGSNGTLTASGGSDYVWSTGDSTSSVSYSNAGIYSVTATIAAGCQTTATGEIVINPIPAIVSSKPHLCTGATVSLYAVGGTNYLWSTGAISDTITIDSIGIYSVTVTNPYGCTAVLRDTFGSFYANPIAHADSALICTGAYASLNATGGTSYLWSNGAVSTNMSTSSPGNYTVTVTNAAGCTAVAHGLVSVYSSTPLLATGDTACLGDTATLTASGGTKYRWSNGDTSSVMRTVVPGNYTVVSKDSLGCVQRVTATFVGLSLPVLTVDSATVCSGDSATLSASGGIAYHWSTGDSTSIMRTTTAGTYYVTAYNSLGCPSTATSTVTLNAVPAITINTTLICTGGYPTLTASGGTSYVWSTGDTAQTLNTSAIGYYSVTATNSIGCSAVVGIMDTGYIAPHFALDSPTICSGDTARITAMGGIHYQWSTGDTIARLLISSPGTYSVTATNAGCTATASAVVTVNPVPTASVSGDTVCSGAIGSISASGGIGYTWSSGDTTAIIHPIMAGLYTVTVTNTYGCTASASDSLYVLCAPPSIPSMTACADSSYNFVFSGVNAGIGGDEIEWTSGHDFDSSSILSSPATFTIQVTSGIIDTIWFRSRNSSTGCIGDSSFAVLTVYPYPLNTQAHAKDTLIPDSLATIIVPYSQTGVTYHVLQNGSILTSVGGTGYTLQIPVMATDTISIFNVYAQDSVSGCNSKDTAIVTFKQLPLPPVAPPTQSTYSDTAVLFTFSNVTAGRGGDRIEWATNMKFDSSTVVPSPTDISIIVQPQTSKMVWIRTKNSITGLVGKCVTAMAINNKPVSALATYISLATEEDMHKDLTISAPVGETSGQHGTTPTGALTYSIPLNVPAGTNNMTPRISFEYNSQAGNGHLGNGWNLGGLSSITRGGANNFYDGKTGAITFTNDDHFLLDGEILVPIVGLNGSAGSVYGKLIEEYSKITSLGVDPAAGGPDHFTVQMKDGMIMEYGNTEDSKIRADNGAITAWKLNRIIDQDGNYIDYKYHNEPNDDYDPRLTEIDYTGNDNQGIQTYSTVQFSYTPRSDAYTIYTAGSHLNFKYLLSQVTITCFGAHFKTYDLAYASDGIMSHLQSITEHGTNGDALNPTIFKYGDAPDLNSYISTTDPFLDGLINTNDANGIATKNKQLLTADFNGDGFSDVLTIRQGSNTDARFSLHNTEALVQFMNPITGHFELKATLEEDLSQYAQYPLDDNNIVWSGLGFPVKPSSLFTQGDYNFFVGDFLGTGRSGVLQIRKYFEQGSYNDAGGVLHLDQSKLHIKDIIYYTFDDNGTVNAMTFQTPPTDNSDFAYSPEHWFYQGDFDGDGKMDYVIVTSNGAYVSFPGHSTPEYNLPIGGNSFSLPGIAHGCDSWLNINCPNSLVYVGDFNGDGKSDLFIVNDSTNYSKSPTVFNLTKNGSGVYELENLFSYYSFTKAAHGIVNYYPGDFNGDGKTDMLIRSSDINKFKAPVISPPATSLLTSYANYCQTVPSLVDDQNDPHGNNSSSTEWYVWFSTGSTFDYPVKIKEYDYIPHNASNGTFDPVISDYNGDGKSDILFLYNQVGRYNPVGSNAVFWSYYGCTSLDIYYSKGSSFELHNVASGLSQMDANYSVCGDFNGDGRADISFYNLSAFTNGSNSHCNSLVPTGTDYVQLSFNPRGQERLLQEVLDGFNQLKVFKYSLLTNPGEHKMGTSRTYPMISAQPGVNVVSQILIPDGAGGINVTDYRYEDARIHRGGKGFLGFVNIEAVSSVAGTTTKITRDFNAPYYVPMTSHASVFLNNSTSGLSENYSFYTFLPLGNPSPTAIQRCAILKSEEFDVNVPANSYKESDYQYDNYGNIINSTVDINGIESTHIESSFGLYGGSVPSKPTQVRLTQSRVGSSSYSNVTLMSYDSKGHKMGAIDGFGKDCAVATGWQYNGFGNVISITTITNTSAGGTRHQYFQYDNFGRCLQIFTNALGQDEISGYDITGQLWSKPNSVRHVDNHSDLYSYDAFGRLTENINPNGISVTTTYAWAPNHSGSKSIFSILAHAAGSPDVTIWNDAMGRQVFKSVKGFGTQGDVLLSTNYNATGSVSSKVGPYYSTSTSVSYNAFSYTDQFHPTCPTVIYDQFGSSSIVYSYSADGSLVTHVMDAAGRQTEKTVDPTGKLIKSSDNGGTLSFRYDGYGNKIEVSMSGHTILTTTYDACNNVSQSTEANSGTKHYHFDGYGQLLSQSDASNHIYDMIYDVAGRLTTKGGPEGLAIYTYYQIGQNGVGQIHEIRQSQGGGSGNSQTFEYDSYGRLTKSTDIITGQSYTTEYSYYLDGKVQYILYPSGYPFAYEYDANGYLLNIKNVATSHTMYTVNSMNEYGQATSYTTGNGKTSSLLTSYGFPTRYSTPGIQDLELTYDWPSRDLLSRTDHIPSSPLTEAFTYDASDRLKSSQVGSGPLMTYSFSDNGNLTSKPDAGSYTYDGTKINATKHVSNPNNNISINTQDITYTAFNKAAMITENGYELDYAYGPDHKRKTSILKNGGTTVMSHLYSGTNYEVVDDQTGNPLHLHYISGVNGLFAIVVTDNYGGINEHYIYTDQIGSILTVTDGNGTVEARQNFDAWGRKRNPADWSYAGIPAVPSWLYRGYTGHEHLEEFSLINMNGRMYDPVLGQMLSPDNVIHDESGTQSYNRYAYAANNPLKYTDPTGWDYGDENDNEDYEDDEEGAQTGSFTYTYNGVDYQINYTASSASDYSFQYEYSASQSIDGNNPNGAMGERAGVDLTVGPNGSSDLNAGALPPDALTDITNKVAGIANSIYNPVCIQNLPIQDMSSAQGVELQGTVSAAAPSLMRDWSQSSSFLGSTTYSMTNDLWIGAQGFLGLKNFNTGGTINNLGGGIASWSQKQNGSVNTAITLIGAAAGPLLKPGSAVANNIGKEFYNFGRSAAEHMADPDRYVPIDILDQVIEDRIIGPDPKGSRALMYYGELWKNETLYTIEVLYDKTTNSIWHFLYYR